MTDFVEFGRIDTRGASGLFINSKLPQNPKMTYLIQPIFRLYILKAIFKGRYIGQQEPFRGP